MMYDKFFFVTLNLVIILIVILVYFFSKNKNKFLLFIILFVSIQAYNIYFLIVNSERVTYNKIRYNEAINKSSFRELKCENTVLEFYTNNSIKILRQSNNLNLFYKSILNYAFLFEKNYFEKQNSFSKVASIVSLTSNIYPFASEQSLFFKGNGICIDNLPERYFIDKLKTAKYACCGDYCYITSKVLSLAGIKSRYIFTKQHLLLEVYCDKKWILVDPTFGLVYDQNYFYNKNYNVLVLPNMGLIKESKNFRNSFFITRDYMLYVTLNSSLKNSLYKATMEYSTFEQKYLLE